MQVKDSPVVILTKIKIKVVPGLEDLGLAQGNTDGQQKTFKRAFFKVLCMWAPRGKQLE